jgi:hypothetical protein
MLKLMLPCDSRLATGATLKEALLSYVGGLLDTHAVVLFRAYFGLAAAFAWSRLFIELFLVHR